MNEKEVEFGVRIRFKADEEHYEDSVIKSFIEKSIREMIGVDFFEVELLSKVEKPIGAIV